MTYQPVDIVARVRLATNERGRDPDWYLATDEAAEDTAEWRSALVAELERVFEAVAKSMGEGLESDFDRGKAHGKLAAYAYAIHNIRGE